MFRCKNCNEVDNFSLMLSPEYKGPGVFKQNINEHGEIVINIDGYEFIPDLAFMNSHAVCKFCGAINNFEYFFEHIASEEQGVTSKKDNKVDIEVDKIPEKRSKKNKNE